jgi:hypothetical protein
MADQADAAKPRPTFRGKPKTGISAKKAQS